MTRMRLLGTHVLPWEASQMDGAAAVAQQCVKSPSPKPPFT
jgi:hypothetical protein